MTTQEAARWCPGCAQRTANAPLPQLADDGQPSPPIGPDLPEGQVRRYYCLRCRAIWQSVEVPASLLAELLSRGPYIEELQRQIAVLRFLLASLRQENQRASREHVRPAAATLEMPRRMAA